MSISLFTLDADLGDLYTVNGVDAPQVWDGLRDSFVEVGMDAPLTAPVVSGSGVGAIVGTYWAYLRFVDSAGNFSNLSPISNEYLSSGSNGVASIVYASVAVPTESKVVRRQILRNTDGQAETFYVDVDTADLTATTFTSSLTDTLLGAGIAQPLLDDQGLPLANGNAKPPNFFKCIAQQLDRMFMAGLLEYTKGSCSVTLGSPTVIGAGTNWKSTFAGRFLYVDGASRTYEVLSVDEATQTLTLTDNYNDVSNLFAFYAIKAPPAYRRVIQFSQAGKPQSWPAHNAFSLQETGDEITGLFQYGPYLYISERAHLHKFTFANNPLTDGAVFMAANRGAVNQRCIVVVDESAYMLDELGVHKFSGNRQMEAVSVGIQAMFRADEDVVHRINWHWKEFFHAVLDRQRETIRFFVSLDGSRYPRHCLALQYRSQRWWVESVPVSVGGSCSGYVNGFQGVPQVYYGGQFNAVYAASAGHTDGVSAEAGTVRSTATSASVYGLTDSQQSWPASGVVNSQVAIVSGTGKGQSRRIVAVSSNTMTIEMPWNVLPDATSVYQIGGISWKYRSSWLRIAPSEYTMPSRFEMLFEPLTDLAKADLRFLVDFSGEAEEQATSFAAASGDGIASTKGESDLVVDLSRENGQVAMIRPSGKEYFIRGKRFVQYDLAGCTHEEQVRLYGFTYEGVLPQTGE